MTTVVDTRTAGEWAERTVYADGRLRVTASIMLADPRDRRVEPAGGWDAWHERDDWRPSDDAALEVRSEQAVKLCPHKARLEIWSGPDFRSPAHSVARVEPTYDHAVAAVARMTDALKVLGFGLD